MIDLNTSIKLLRICKALFEGTDSVEVVLTPDIQLRESCARDLYDIVELQTSNKTLAYQLNEGRKAGYDRLKCIKYVNHRLNLGI